MATDKEYQEAVDRSSDGKATRWDTVPIREYMIEKYWRKHDTDISSPGETGGGGQ